MPYITQDRRDELEGAEVRQHGRQTIVPGELNYLITELCQGYYDRRGLDYQAINDVLGALEGAKLEFYTRVARRYEDKKIIENGDVY